MRPSPWLHMILLLVLLGSLAACGSGEADHTEEPTPPAELYPNPATFIGVQELGPLPEYTLALYLDTAGQRLTGRQRVTIPNRTGAEWNQVVFRLYPNLPQYDGAMNVGQVWVDGQQTGASLRADDTSLAIPLSEPLPPQATVTISMTFDIALSLVDSGYVLFGHSQGIWILPDAYPLLAVHDGSAWHEDLAPAHGDAVFADAAFYDVTLTLPQTLTLATTGFVIGETAASAQESTYQIIGGPFREFAFLASTDYLVAERLASGVTVRSYYLPGDEAAGQAALNTAAASLRVYSEAFGPYPFPAMDVAAAPLLHYGMEYPGLNLVGLDLYRGKRPELENRLAHEVAHQWWYAQVGNDQVNTPWLDEGLAEHSTATYYRQVFGEARANTLVNQRWLVPYQMAVENGYDAIVNQPSAAFGQEYEAMVYAKAAMFFNALRQQLGDDLYQAVLREYVDRYRWRIATPDDFLRLAESVSGQELDGLYSRWILSRR